jgi:tetratricopeptide (TPR) repeat protein
MLKHSNVVRLRSGTVVEKTLTSLQRSLAARLISLAEEALNKGEVVEAERLYREVLHFLELILEPNHVEIAKTLYKLAYILEFQDKVSESLDLISRARAILRNADRDVLNIDALFTPFSTERPS